MNYISLFSGIEAASVAWGTLGWNPVAFSEIEPFCCDLLEKRFPDVPNLGDVSGVDWTEYEGSVDVIIGGSPCQAFSLAGRRLGLMDERGKLMLEFVRCVREVGPRWVVWENVPGVLSQDGGRAFGTLLGELEDCGYALAWRVLDAQFFGVPQRRRRVFLVGHPVPGCAAGVLFEPDCMRGDNPPSREKRAQLAADAEGRAGVGHALKLPRSVSGCLTPWDTQGRRVYSADSAYPTLDARETGGQNAQAVLPIDTTQVTDPRNGSNPQWGDPCHAMSAQGHTPAVCIGFSAGQSAKAGSIAAQEEVAPTLRASESGTNQVPSVAYAISGNIIGRDSENGGNHLGIEDDGAMFTLTTADRHAVAFTWNQGTGFSSASECAPTLRAARCGEPAVAITQYGEEIAGTLTARADSSPCIDRGQNIVCMADGNADAAVDQECAGTLKVGGEPPIVATEYIVRRLMPVECERLQGFPDGWTDLGGTPDAPRYRACGNSMAVPVINYIGRRIEAVDSVF